MCLICMCLIIAVSFFFVELHSVLRGKFSEFIWESGEKQEKVYCLRFMMDNGESVAGFPATDFF